MRRTGMIPDGPRIFLREERGGPPRARVERILAYLNVRDARRQREYDREAVETRREAERFAPCAICGEQTDIWERSRDARLSICQRHWRSMPGNFPKLSSGEAPMPGEIESPLAAARKALYLLERHIAGRPIF